MNLREQFTKIVIMPTRADFDNDGIYVIAKANWNESYFLWCESQLIALKLKVNQSPVVHCDDPDDIYAHIERGAFSGSNQIRLVEIEDGE